MHLARREEEYREGFHGIVYKVHGMHACTLGNKQHEVEIMAVRVVGYFKLPDVFFQQLDIEEWALAAFVAEGLDVVDRQ